MFTRSRSRLNFCGAVRQIYQLHREKHQQNANRNISGAQIQNIEAGKYVESGERNNTWAGWRDQSRVDNAKSGTTRSFLENMPSSAVIYSSKGLENRREEPK